MVVQKMCKRYGESPPLEESKPAKLNMSIRKLEEEDALLKKGVHQRTCNRLIVSSIGIARAIRVIEGKAFGQNDSDEWILSILKEALHKSEMSHMDVDVNEIEALQDTYELACKALE